MKPNILIQKRGRWIEGHFKDLKPGMVFAQECADGKNVVARAEGRPYFHKGVRTVMVTVTGTY